VSVSRYVAMSLCGSLTEIVCNMACDLSSENNLSL
jgi:hypothetical protein